MKFSVYKWHSVNLIPFVSGIPTADDVSYKIVGYVIQLTLFGFVLNWSFDTEKKYKSFHLYFISPIYSRNRKKWYIYG